MIRKRGWSYWSVLLGFLVLAACCPVDKHLLGDPQNPYPLRSEPKLGEIVHLPTGRLVSQKQMIDVAGDARIVYVGETHDNPASHRLELDLLTSLSGLHPQRQALGMEMFVRSQQPVLDRWVAGALDEKEFLREARWFENWKIDFDYYRELLIYARDNKIPVIALNAEKKLVNTVRVTPPEQLGADVQARLPELDMTDPYQRSTVEAFFSDHTHGKMMLDGFIRAQTLWDETMAETVATYLESPAGQGMHILVVAGGNHVNYGFGIPRRVFRRLPASYVTVGGQEIRISKSKEPQMMDVTLPVFPMVPFDFLAYIDYADLQKAGVRLGVMTLPPTQGSGMIIKQVLPGSLAERNGVLKEDLLLSIDGEDLKDSIDLVYALKQKHPGDKMILHVERHGKPLNVEVAVPLSEEKETREKK